jgi:hypothetical protein
MASIAHQQAVPEHRNLPNTEIFAAKDVASVHYAKKSESAAIISPYIMKYIVIYSIKDSCIDFYILYTVC